MVSIQDAFAVIPYEREQAHHLLFPNKSAIEQCIDNQSSFPLMKAGM